MRTVNYAWLRKPADASCTITSTEIKSEERFAITIKRSPVFRVSSVIRMASVPEHPRHCVSHSQAFICITSANIIDDDCGRMNLRLNILSLSRSPGPARELYSRICPRECTAACREDVYKATQSIWRQIDSGENE